VTRMTRMSVVLAFALAAGSALAADTLPARGGRSTYGSAGCGVGSLIFGDQPGLVQVLAATTNGILGNQTFGITTGTLNCGEAAIGTKGAQLFIEANKEALAKDASRGSGETIATLSHLAGCKDASAVGVALQKNFSTVVPDGSKADVEKTLSTLRAEKSLACNQLG
jgi:Protein of unknown function (DUF3015)